MISKPTLGRAASRRQGWLWLIVIVALIGLAWAGFGAKHYYRWVLSGTVVDIKIFCDPSPLRGQDVRALVLYDKVALSPIPKALGLLQNRGARDARNFHIITVGSFEITPVSVKLNSVPYGPICKVMFVADGKKYLVDVDDRRLIHNTIYVRVPDDSVGQIKANSRDRLETDL